MNHRGSSMNLGFQSIHRVLTREFLSIIKKTIVNKKKKKKIKEKEIGKEKIQEACKNQLSRLDFLAL